MESNYLTAKQLSIQHPEFSIRTLRYLISTRHTNGFDVAVRKLGARKVVINLKEFEKWIERTRERKFL